MDMLPFGETVRVWRLERGLTQEALARRARLPRPNLSAIERGRREATLRTIRALADALDIRAGQLVEGEPPPAHAAASRLSRAALERVAQAVIHGRALSDPAEQALAERLASLVAPRLRAGGIVLKLPRRRRRRSEKAWLALAPAGPEILRTLSERALNALERRA